MEGNEKLSAQTIASLDSKIKEQGIQMNQLMERTNTANAQVQDIAVKAIENSSRSTTAYHTLPAYDRVERMERVKAGEKI